MQLHISSNPIIIAIKLLKVGDETRKRRRRDGLDASRGVRRH